MINLINKSRVKEQSTLNVSSQFYDHLNMKVAKIIKDCEERAKGNGRKTLKPVDL